jgi:signal transduction histidine kinase
MLNLVQLPAASPTAEPPETSRGWRWGLSLLGVLALAAVLPPLHLSDQQSALPILMMIVLCAWFGGPGPGFLAPPLFLGAIHLFYGRIEGVEPLSAKQVSDAAALSVLGLLIGISIWSRKRYLAQLRKHTLLLEQQARELRDVDRRKDRFLAILAHELRNPLAPVRNGIELLRLGSEDGVDPELAREVCGIIERQVVQMVRLIDDLLDVSRINTGKIRLQRERIDLADVIRDAVETSRPNLDLGRHQLDVSLPEGPLRIDADRARLSQVVQNLLNNAAKFTKPGGRIAVSLAREGDHALIRVRDSGVGIPPEMLTRIFEVFTQVDNSLERSHGGLGIGLSLVRVLVGMHDGKVTAHSEGRGRGSEFVIELPLPPEPARLAETATEAAKQSVASIERVPSLEAAT